MADETTTAPESGAPADGGAGDVQIRDTPNDAGMIPASEVAGLKSALEKLKQENSKLKPLSKLLEDGLDPATLPEKLAALKNQQTTEEQLSKLKAEWESTSEAEKKQLTQRYEGQVSALNSYLKQQTRAQELTNLYVAGGGSSQNELDAKQFRSLAQDFIEFEDTPIKNDDGVIVGYSSTVKSFKSPDGKNPLWVDHEKEMGKVRPGELQDFLAQAKQGKYGTALQSLLPAYNQSSGSGISVMGGIGGSSGKLQIKRSQLANMGLAASKGGLSAEQMAAVKSGNYDLID